MITKKIKIFICCLFVLIVPVSIVPTIVSCSNTNTNIPESIVDSTTNLRKNDLFTFNVASPAVQNVINHDTFNLLKSANNTFLDGSNQISISSVTEYYDNNQNKKLRYENTEINKNWNLNFLNVQENYISFAVSSFISINRKEYENGNITKELYFVDKFIPTIVSYKYNPNTTSPSGSINNDGTWIKCVFKENLEQSSTNATNLDEYLTWYKTYYANNSNNWISTSTSEITEKSINQLKITDESVNSIISSKDLNFELNEGQQYQKSEAKVTFN